MPTCAACAAPIVFVRTRQRKLMPIDSTIAIENAVDRDVTLTFEDLRDSLGEAVVVSHFATCTEPGRFRHK